ncbi:MAG: RAMP superfamily CRISPR-associated protein [Chloroflexota bacterium]
MTPPISQSLNSRKVAERVFVKARLTLKTPAHFGNGDGGALTDIPLLRDALTGRPLLTGASIAGALRNYLREYKHGYGTGENKIGDTLAEKLFGYVHEEKDREENDASYESWFFVDDALGTPPDKDHAVELRDGVAINAVTRTAERSEKGKGYLFDIELLSAGTTFDLGFELWLTESNRDELLEGLAIALHGLTSGAIRLGMRKRRGYGECAAKITEISRYNMSDPKHVVAWLERRPVGGELPQPSGKHIGESFVMEAHFRLAKDSSLLIRSETGSGNSPDMVHLRSWRGNEAKPILSGTSLTGVLRSRALRIAKTKKEPAAAEEFINEMFGKRIKPNGKDKPTGSLLIVNETEIEPAQAIVDRVQSRVKIDRFTGGAYPTGLFSQQPVFGNHHTEIHMRLELRKTPKTETQFHAQIGLLLFVLKDLWTEDLPIGGESSVGRGRLTGQFTRLSLGDKTWEITADGSNLIFGGNGTPAELEAFGQAFAGGVK